MVPRLQNETNQILREEFRAGRAITAYDAEIICNIDLRNAREHLKSLYREGIIYIAHWRRDALVGPWMPVYKWGTLSDAPRPLSQKERIRNFLGKKK